MLVKILKSKLHRARVTQTSVNYPGSIAVDSDLMEAAGLLPYEAVWIADVNNGNRLETYVVPAEAGCGQVRVLGAAARLINPQDIVIIFSFAFCTADEAKEHKPRVVVLDEHNKIIK
ncbi:MAG: aspartate 1-decarboxylase [Planctomycetota bacterium]|jgi:aspartate 1-decarboxylase